MDQIGLIQAIIGILTHYQGKVMSMIGQTIQNRYQIEKEVEAISNWLISKLEEIISGRRSR